ncbi:MAG: SGNH/GDSL hydrolase family protein [Rhodoglobus sp.]
MTSTHWHRYAAVGGSGMPAGDINAPGWTDRLAIILNGTALLRGEEFSYSDLSNGNDALTRQTLSAIRLRADLVSVVVSPSSLLADNPRQLSGIVERSVSDLRDAGCDVLLATTFDPRIALPLGPLRERAAEFTASLWSVAREHGAFTLDLWNARGFEHPHLWTLDRACLTAAGHRLVAIHAARALGIGYYQTAHTAHDEADRRVPALAV